MKQSLKFEEVLMFSGAASLLYTIEIPWWVYIILVIGPDISMAGYAAGNKAGAALYNLFHHKGVALAVAFAGYGFQHEVLMITGIILFGHSSMDRIFGYGLKYITSFKHTHLGTIGDSKNG